jgi:signal transduction histidine kinase/CheY-like chemotaxis protein
MVLNDIEATGRVALSRTAAGVTERRVALGVIAFSAITFVMIAPFARVHLPKSDAFIPLYQSALFITDLVTAVLLFGQFAQQRTRGLLVLATAYLFDALIIIPHSMSFPGLFAPQGLMGSGPQTTAWLYSFWHGGFALFIIAYALLADRQMENSNIGALIAGSAAGVVALVIAITLLCTSGHELLPTVMDGRDYTLLVTKGISPVICVFTLIALWLLWPRRTISVLDLWLIVVMSVWLCDVGLSAVVGSSRFDLGFYAGRCFGLIASSFLLVCLLLEMHKLYGRLAEALDLAQRRNQELTESREQLAQAQRFEAMGQLTGGVAHDFNNLLTIIDGSLDMILRSPKDDQKVERWATAAKTASARGATLTQQLLTFARRQVSRPETVNVNRLIENFDLLLRRAVGDGVEIRMDLSRVLDPVSIDPSHFEAALLNVVLNARDAMPNGGTITIKTENRPIEQERPSEDLKPGPYIVVSVADDGAGMPADVMARVFDPFFTTKEVGRGSGLGLSQVYGFAKGSGGHVAMESQQGRGTVVTLYLPRAPSRPQSRETEPTPLPVRPAQNGETILVVEDEPLVLSFVAEELTSIGYRVLTATNAEQALDLIRQNEQIDVLFSDIVMPGGMNGVQLAVEAGRIRPALKVLLTSGYAASALGEGIPDGTDLLGKPYQPDELARKLRLVISR